MANTVGAFICLIIVFGIYTFNEKAQSAITLNKKLAEYGKTQCQELTFDTPLDDIVDGCYWYRSDFKLTEDVVAAKILPEQLKCHKISMHQSVMQWQSYEVTVCDDYKRGQKVEGQHREYKIGSKSSWDEETLKAYNEDMDSKSSDCHTETHYGWNDENQGNFHFPASDSEHGDTNHINQGIVQVQRGAFANDTSLRQIGWGHSATGALSDLAAWVLMFIQAKPGSSETVNPIDGTFYPDANDEAIRLGAYPVMHEETEYQAYPLCFTSDIAAEFTSIGNGNGLTNAEFQGLSQYGDINYFPHCNSNNIQLGTYKVEVWCEGAEHADNLVVSEIYREDSGNNGTVLKSRPWKDSMFPDTSEAMETYLFLYTDGVNENGAEKTVDEAFAHHEKVLNDLAAATEHYSYIGMGFFGFCALMALKAKNKSSSSSSS